MRREKRRLQQFLGGRPNPQNERAGVMLIGSAQKKFASASLRKYARWAPNNTTARVGTHTHTQSAKHMQPERYEVTIATSSPRRLSHRVSRVAHLYVCACVLEELMYIKDSVSPILLYYQRKPNGELQIHVTQEGVNLSFIFCFSFLTAIMQLARW